MAIQEQFITAESFLALVEQPQYQDRVLELVEGTIVEMSKPTAGSMEIIVMRLAVNIANRHAMTRLTRVSDVFVRRDAGFRP